MPDSTTPITAPARLVDRVRAGAIAQAPTIGKVFALAVLVVGARTCTSEKAPDKSLDGLVRALGHAANVVVAPSDFVWEASEGLIGDAFSGRHILFLGSEKPGSPRDLYRARVRLTPEGRPIEVRDVVDLTSTPFGDDTTLVRDEHATRAAFATYAQGELQGITALDLRGEGRAAVTETRFERFMLYVTNIQETGDGAGIARVQVVPERTAKSAKLRFDGGALVVDFNGDGGAMHARIDVDQAQILEPIATPSPLRVELLKHIPKRPIHWAVDTVRAIPWIGGTPIAWLESKVWEFKDKARQLAYSFKKPESKNEVKVDVEAIKPRPLDASAAGIDGGFWPPQPVPTIFSTPEPEEGEWIAYQPEWMHKIPGAPAPFYRTFIRPDPQRPYSKIILLAMDTRQLDFDMEAGVEDPKPTVGSFHGTGRIPREPQIAAHVVAAFNGGFKTEHGHYGMAIKRRVLLPPVPNAATAVVTDDGHFGMGSWSQSREIPLDILSYRQNMDPLVDDGVINPRQRPSWGAVLPGQPKLTGQQTERSGLCITKAKHLLYVWGDDVGPEALGKGMQLAGCDYGMHLDMNPYHTGFVFMSFDDTQLKSGHSETLTPLMAIGPRRYIDYNPKDFFYALLRDPAVPPSAGGVAWAADGGVQPPPTWLPALWSGEKSDATVDGGKVTLLRIDPTRVRWELRAGSTEKREISGLPREMTGDDAKRVIAAIGIGTAPIHGAWGLRIDGHVGAGMSPHLGTIVVAAEGGMSIAAPGEPEAPMSSDLVQGEMIVDAGKATDASGRTGPLRARTAIGVTKAGHVVVARAKTTSLVSLANALIAADCVRAIAARGDEDSEVARAGTSDVPMASYPQTTLYAIAKPMGPRAFRFDQAADGKALWPAATKPVP